MPSHEANEETIQYGDTVLLLNQYAIPDTSVTAGYLETHEKVDDNTYGVRTSHDPLRDVRTTSGLWVTRGMGPVSFHSSGPLKYGDLILLGAPVTTYDIAGCFFLETHNEGKEIRATRTRGPFGMRSGNAWRITHDNIKDTNEDFVQNGDRVKLVQDPSPEYPIIPPSQREKALLYLDTNGTPQGYVPGTYAVKTSHEANRDAGSGTWQIMRYVQRDD